MIPEKNAMRKQNKNDELIKSENGHKIREISLVAEGDCGGKSVRKKLAFLWYRSGYAVTAKCGCVYLILPHHNVVLC